MEDSLNTIHPHLDTELRNLTEIEARIEEAKRSLNQLTKLETL